ncbi:F-box/LRR-repeat protein At4g14103-like [Corylus avellana]|uniref:F-box/LRR-repeat protein At4g14103-like n=1 Tax=Corylus avellana TaxID=13451 RepID=UPI00286A46B1|nr:F-box/LRR-repeat protein At4g14103-like [Corylus avellana]
MEQPTKQKSVHDADDDGRFSDLPDEIVHRILSFLRMRDLSRLSVVSRRRRELCISNPHLDLSNIDLINSDESSRSRFNSFVDRLISLRWMHRVKTQTFRLRWSFVGGDDEYRVATWLQHAVNMGVARINLELVLDLGKPFDLPHCVLGCNSLRQLKVDAGDGFVKLPSPYFAATNLQWLELRPVRIGCNVNIGELLSSFKSLKCLWLDKISGTKSMTFTSPSVVSLILSNYDDELCNISILQEKLQVLGISWSSKSGGKSLTISAPNLKRFYLGGSAVDYYNCMKDFPHLFNAEMGLLSFPTHQASSKHIFDKILHSIQRAKCLTINECFVEVLLEQGCLPFLFDNLEHLTVRRSSRGVQVLPLCSLLRGIIKLKHLTVSCLTRDFANVTNSMPSREFSFKMGYWESQDLMFTRQLKKVTMVLFDKEDEVELIKYLLKNAEELEVMEILYTSPVSSDLITEIRRYDQRG